MRFCIIFLFACCVHAKLTWRKPVVFQIKEELFKAKVIDEYTADLSEASINPTTHDPQIIFADRNPYKSNITRFAIYNEDYIDPIPVYDLNRVQVKLITDVYIECYEYDDCAYELTKEDREELSLYASFIEMSGTGTVSSSYSLGLIRSKFTTNILGMYTQGFEGLSNNIGFWIRLEDGSGSRLYSNLATNSKTVAMLDMSIHERSHYDEPTFSSGAAHCDPFQANYNYLFQRAARELPSYVHVTEMSTSVLSTELLLIIGNVFAFLIIVFLVWYVLSYSCKETASQPQYQKLDPKEASVKQASDTVIKY